MHVSTGQSNGTHQIDEFLGCNMSGIPTKAQYPSRKLYELAGGNIARKTSPFCWRIRFALAEKQLSYDSIPWRRVDKDVLEFTGQGKVQHSVLT